MGTLGVGPLNHGTEPDPVEVDLMAHAARLLTPYKRPSEIVMVDALPAASTGKILKHRIGRRGS
jgi:acyl-CoA synthetase (AMP-forming)/AMP-acid ligase II